MNYDVDFFIKKFSAIAEVFWFVGDYQNEDGTKFCAAGHCGGYQGMPSDSEAQFLCNLIAAELYPYSIGGINDGKCMAYPQPTPKQRVLAALRDIKAKRDAQSTPEPKERIVYVTIDSEVKELQKQTQFN